MMRDVTLRDLKAMQTTRIIDTVKLTRSNPRQLRAFAARAGTQPPALAFAVAVRPALGRPRGHFARGGTTTSASA
jgi:hypothetical protein